MRILNKYCELLSQPALSNCDICLQILQIFQEIFNLHVLLYYCIIVLLLKISRQNENYINEQRKTKIFKHKKES